MMHKIVNETAPKSLIAKCPKNIKRHIHNDRDICPEPRVKTFMKCLHYSGGTLWNSLPSYLQQTKELSTFKTRYKKHLFTQI